jgi:hypothetical protein
VLWVKQSLMDGLGAVPINPGETARVSWQPEA